MTQLDNNRRLTFVMIVFFPSLHPTRSSCESLVQPMCSQRGSHALPAIGFETPLEFLMSIILFSTFLKRVRSGDHPAQNLQTHRRCGPQLRQILSPSLAWTGVLQPRSSFRAKLHAPSLLAPNDCWLGQGSARLISCSAAP
ncbi:hypothetical protein BJX68DRAFT_204305 [Aspergillus pseudodeflectus]|uniref:Uncharacterized protein n=1 Tax=Aspergillus pseudodeflectus TaxID=176178 RepID=A0ABR4KVC4_9EURO